MTTPTSPRSGPLRAARPVAGRRRATAVLAGLALAFTGLLATAPAHAAVRAVEEGTLAWGFKESFRSYVARQTGSLDPIGPAPVGQRIVVSDGARFDPAGVPAFPGSSSSPNESLPYRFAATEGSVTDTETLVVRTSGAVTYHFPSHHFEVRISNLAVVVEDGEGRIVGDVYQNATEDFGQFEKGEKDLAGVTIGRAKAVEVTIDGDTVRVRGSDLVVDAAAAEALPQTAGEALDDFTLTASLGEVVDDGQPGPGPSPTPSPSPTQPEPGELSWHVDGPGAVSLGTASVGEDGFLATAVLPAVVVSDSRSDGPGWRITGQVTDFTADDGVLRARHVGWVPAVLDAGAGAVAGGTITPRLVTGKGKGLAVPRTLGHAPAGHPVGTATLGGTLELRAPLGTAPGSYRAVLTITAVS